ncbi:MAG: cell shape-determining protein MreC [Phycisphaerae bacterium]|nr:MAG: cell shape-determining protein MreC [Phycisphaerae bacterium]
MTGGPDPGYSTFVKRGQLFKTRVLLTGVFTIRLVPIILPFLALLAALTLPDVKSAVRTTFRSLFAPIAWPARTAGLIFHKATTSVDSGSLFSPDPSELSPEALLVQIQNLNAQLEDLKKLSHLYQQLGEPLRRISRIVPVTSGPVDQRQTITLNTSGLTGLRNNAPVHHPLGFVGRIDSVGAGSARVLLITDPSSKITGRFVRYQPRPDGGIDILRLDIRPPLLEGATDRMIARAIPAAEIRNVLKLGDIVELDDDRFPIPALKGLRVGVVTGIDLPPTDAGFARIEVKPTVDLVSLREVLVVIPPAGS